jgi:hypothetical protein
MIQERDDDVTCWIMHELPWDFWQFPGARTKIYAFGGDTERVILLFLQSAYSTLQISFSDYNIFNANLRLTILSNFKLRY